MVIASTLDPLPAPRLYFKETAGSPLLWLLSEQDRIKNPGQSSPDRVRLCVWRTGLLFTPKCKTYSGSEPLAWRSFANMGRLKRMRARLKFGEEQDE